MRNIFNQNVRKTIAKILHCCLFGAPMGLSVQLFFWLMASWLRGDGQLYYVSWHLLRMYGTELNAVTAQCICSGVLGMLWASATLIFRETDWNLLKQTLIHFVICVVPSLIFAYWMYWMPRSLDGLSQYLLLFLVLYGINWLIQYFSLRKRIKQINEDLRSLKEGQE